MGAKGSFTSMGKPVFCLVIGGSIIVFTQSQDSGTTARQGQIKVNKGWLEGGLYKHTSDITLVDLFPLPK